MSPSHFPAITSAVRQSRVFLGIDLTSSPAKPSACLGVDNSGQLVYFGFATHDDDIISITEFYSPQVIAIDAPLSLPAGLCCLELDCPCKAESGRKSRECDQELRLLGIPCYPTSKKSFIKDLISRGIQLKNRLRQQESQVIEIYPYASKVRLFGKAMPRKTTPQGMAFIKRQLECLLPDLKPYLNCFDHDLCDAAVAAYTALLYHQNKTDALGERKEGLIFIPRVRFDSQLYSC